MKRKGAQHSKPPPSDNLSTHPNERAGEAKEFGSSRMRVSSLVGFVVFFFLSAISTGCGPQREKGQACKKNEECKGELKCIAGRCSDGTAGNFCRQDSDCLQVQGLKCIERECMQASSSETSPEHLEMPPEEGTTEEPTLEPSPEPPQEPKQEPPPEPEPDILEPPVETQDAGDLLPETSPDRPTQSTCRINTDCPAGQYCLIGKDRLHATCAQKPTSCKREQDCQSQPGTHCRVSSFGANQTGLACLYPYDTGKPLKKAGEVCKATEDCESRYCLNEAKVCGAYCTSDSDCPKDYYCGVYGFFQIGDFPGCYPKCKSDSDCPKDYACDAKQHCTVQNGQKIGSPCRSNTDCGSGKLCVNGWSGGTCTQDCFNTQKTCNTDTNCGLGQVCQTNVITNAKHCAVACPKGSACTFFSGTSAFCLAGCQKDADCRADYYCGTVASNNICLPRGQKKIGEACTLDSDCQSGSCQLLPSGRYCTQTCTGSDCPTGFSCNSFGSTKFCDKDCFKDSECAGRLQVFGTTLHNPSKYHEPRSWKCL